MSNIFDNDKDAETLATSFWRRVELSLLLTDDEINALTNGKFIVHQVEGYGLIMGNELSFDREYEKRMKEIDEKFNGESDE